MKKVTAMLIVLALVMSGCAKKVDPDAYKDRAIELIESNLDEEFEYQGSKYEEAFDRYVYSFSSKERDMLITVQSYIENNERIFYTNYYECIFDLYTEEVLEYLQNKNVFVNNGKIGISGMGDIEVLSEALAFCNTMYAVENMYHTGTFTDEHPLFTFDLTDGYGTVFMQIIVDGVLTKDDIQYYICSQYNEKVAPLD